MSLRKAGRCRTWTRPVQRPSVWHRLAESLVLFRMRFRSDDRLERMCRAAYFSDGHTVTHGRICFESFQEVVLKNTVCGVLQRLLGAACAAAAAC